jgi:hypothetical protein
VRPRLHMIGHGVCMCTLAYVSARVCQCAGPYAWMGTGVCFWVQSCVSGCTSRCVRAHTKVSRCSGHLDEFSDIGPPECLSCRFTMNRLLQPLVGKTLNYIAFSRGSKKKLSKPDCTLQSATARTVYVKGQAALCVELAADRSDLPCYIRHSIP